MLILFDLYCCMFIGKTVQKWPETPDRKMNVFSLRIAFCWAKDTDGLSTSQWVCLNLMGASIVWVYYITNKSDENPLTQIRTRSYKFWRKETLLWCFWMYFKNLTEYGMRTTHCCQTITVANSNPIYPEGNFNLFRKRYIQNFIRSWKELYKEVS